MPRTTKKEAESLPVYEQPQQKRSPYMPILVILVIIASYLLGMLTTKVQYLEKNGNTSGLTANITPEQVQGAQVTTAPQPTAAPVKPITDKDHIRGASDAPIALIVYTDYECPFCKSFHPTMEELMKEYDGKIRWVYRHYPLSFHQNAQKQAEATECIAELGGNDAFWNFSDKLFERTTSNGTGFALDQLGSLAAEVGVDQQAFQTCLDEGKFTKFVQDSIAQGSAAGVSATPATFLIDQKGKSQLLVGAQPLATFKTAIDKLLKK